MSHPVCNQNVIWRWPNDKEILTRPLVPMNQLLGVPEATVFFPMARRAAFNDLNPRFGSCNPRPPCHDQFLVIIRHCAVTKTLPSQAEVAIQQSRPARLDRDTTRERHTPPQK